MAGAGFVDVSGGDEEVLELHRDTYRAARAQIDPSTLVCHDWFAAAVDLDPGEGGASRFAQCQRLGLDEVILRAGPLEGGHEQAMRRIRFLADLDAATALQ